MNDGLEKLNAWLEDFEFDSEDQRKSALAYMLWLKDKGTVVYSTPMLSGLLSAVRPHDLFLTERVREGQEWQTNLLADHITRLERQIDELRKEIRLLKK